MVDPNPLAHAYGWFECHMGQSLKCSPAYYNSWSGWVSDLAELGLIGVVLAPVVLVYHHHKCTTCRRIGRHRTDDTAQRFCHHHWTRDHIDAARARHRLKFPHHLAHHKPEVKTAITVEIDREKFLKAVGEPVVAEPVAVTPQKTPAKKVSVKKTVAKKKAMPRKKAAPAKRPQ
jgi:hypothetical protein